jgi:iodotyrosine deiodinase
MFKPDMGYKPLPLPHRASLTDEEMQAAADAFLQSMSKRHTVRHYSSRPVALSVIESCIQAAGLAPSGANHQPWHFVAVANPEIKTRIREAAEEEEKKFYDGDAGDEWIKALEPLGTDASKDHLEEAPWLVVIFAERYGEMPDGARYKNYYVNESVGIATGFLITALHQAGLVSLTHTPNPMSFLNDLCDRPASNKPVMILAVGHPSDDATIPTAATVKKPLEDILTVLE